MDKHKLNNIIIALFISSIYLTACIKASALVAVSVLNLAGLINGQSAPKDLEIFIISLSSLKRHSDLAATFKASLIV